MIQLTITQLGEQREITIFAKTMKELIDDKLPKWLPVFERDIQYLRQTQRFRDDPNAEKNERDSGWYYDV